MKLNNIFKTGIFLTAALALAACDKDGDMLTINTGDDVTLQGGNKEIVLDYDNIDGLALTVNWDENGNLTLSNEAVALPDGVLSNTLQLSLEDSFATNVEIPVDAGKYYYQFTTEELNSAMSRLGVAGGERAQVFLRVMSTVGKNIEPTYSNIISVYVTPYKINMTVAYCLDKNQAMTGGTLLSPDENGIYQGFRGVASWENWYMQDGTKVIWGNSAAGATFELESSASGNKMYNLWYPGIAGCYFTTVNTADKYWTALTMPEIIVSGDISGTMTFDRKKCEWTLTFNADPGTKQITFSGTGALYDVSTGDKDSQKTQNYALAGSADALAMADTASPVSVEITGTGEQTLSLTLADALHWKITVDANAPVIVEPALPLLYISGHDDAVSGSWHFNHYLRLYNEEERAYAGGVYFASKWGYKLYKEAGNWDDLWSAGDAAEALAGNLKEGGKTNIPAPEEGLYILNAMLGDLKYEVTPVNTVHYSGLNDDWTKMPMTASDEPGVFTAIVNKTAETPWGVKILINESWDICFGGGSGELKLKADGFDGDNSLANGEYLLTVDLVKGTYSYSAI